MKRKLTASDLALWAALPMAHTSKIESRLTRVSDTTRRRTLPRRAIFFSIAIGAAALVPLAMLRPVAKAQAAMARPDTVELLGVQDINIHHTDHLWWDAEGKILVGRVDVGAPSRTAADLFRSSSGGSNEEKLRFAVRLPDAAKGHAVTFVSSSSFFPKEVAPPGGSFSNAWSLYAWFSGSNKTTTLSVGVPTGPWTETVNCPKIAGTVRLQRPSGEVIFTLIPNPHGLTSVQEIYGSRGLTPVQATPGDAVLIVSDHFHSPSPLPVDKMAILISSYASRTKSSDAVQRLLHDGENDERTVYGLDKSGQLIAKLTGTMDPSLEEEKNDRFQMEQLISIPKPLLKRIASFRLVARPYQWTEFKNVALQPVE